MTPAALGESIVATAQLGQLAVLVVTNDEALAGEPMQHAGIERQIRDGRPAIDRQRRQELELVR
jgi:hypothetical protein